MKIQINTDKNVAGNEELRSTVTDLISDGLSRYQDHITRLEVHLSDVDGDKDGRNDKRCMIEARLEAMQPVAVTELASSFEDAVNGAVEKLRTLLNTKLGRARNY